MSKNVTKQNGTGSPDTTSPIEQPGLSSVGRQILVGLLSRRQLAQRWSCCAHTIARRDDLIPVRLGRRLIRYRLSDIEAIERAAAGGSNERESNPGERVGSDSTSDRESSTSSSGACAA